MSWFDELFGNDKHSDEELLRRKNNVDITQKHKRMVSIPYFLKMMISMIVRVENFVFLLI